MGEWREPTFFGHDAEVGDFIRGYRESRRGYDSVRDLAIASTLTSAARKSLETGATVNIDHAAQAALIDG